MDTEQEEKFVEEKSKKKQRGGRGPMCNGSWAGWRAGQGRVRSVSVYCDLGEERLVNNHRDPWVQLGYVVRRCAEQGGLRSRAGCRAGEGQRHQAAGKV
jgi:hypothetical protein